jgi:hypothetical protein
MMIATTSKAAINERARSNDFDWGLVASGGMAQFPLAQLLSGPALFPKDQRMTIRNVSKQASFFELSATYRSKPAFLSASDRFAPGGISRASCRASTAIALWLRLSGEASCFTMLDLTSS